MGCIYIKWRPTYSYSVAPCAARWRVNATDLWSLTTPCLQITNIERMIWKENNIFAPTRTAKPTNAQTVVQCTCTCIEPTVAHAACYNLIASSTCIVIVYRALSMDSIILICTCVKSLGAFLNNIWTWNLQFSWPPQVFHSMFHPKYWTLICITL